MHARAAALGRITARRRWRALVLIGGVAAAAAAGAAAGPVLLSHGRFNGVPVYLPRGAPLSVALFLSGEAGWDADADSQARALVQHGAMVVGIDSRKFAAALEADGAGCVFPDGDLENLSHFVQAYFHNSTYLKPLLLGVASGAALAYAVLAQAPRDTFSGALTTDFCPTLDLAKPLCKGSGLDYAREDRGSGTNRAQGKFQGLPLAPRAQLGNPWVTLQAPNAACSTAAAREFAAQVEGAALVTLPRTSPAPLMAAYTALSQHKAGADAAPPAILSDLPVVEVAATAGSAPSHFFAIIMSGDGGWAGLDRDIAAALSAKGIPVAGLDSLRYYWSARTPEGLAADTDRMIRYYSSHFGKPRVLLIGYSQGADVLPFAVNRLPAASKQQVALVAILGMSEHALFEFHLSNWISDDNSGPATLPEVQRITGAPVLCIYGEDESDSLCPKLDANKVIVLEVKGGHHFDGNYAALAEHIVAAAAH